MPTSKKYYVAAFVGQGFITHDDQEKNGLRFSVAIKSRSTSDALIVVSGNIRKISSWASRVKAVEKTKQEAQDFGNKCVEGLFEVDEHGQLTQTPISFDINKY